MLPHSSLSFFIRKIHNNIFRIHLLIFVTKEKYFFSKFLEFIETIYNTNVTLFPNEKKNAKQRYAYVIVYRAIFDK